MILVDAFDPQSYGGTGHRIAAAELSGVTAPLPLIIAGGIHPGNAPELWQNHHPFALDICSGGESSPGVKDAARLTQLFSQ